MRRFAEDWNYFDTTVHPAKSQAEIIEMLEDFGAIDYVIQQGQSGGKFAWLVRFGWEGKSYRFAFTPLDCRNPNNERSFGGKRRKFSEQARYQMGRIAVHFTKAILTAAEGNPDSLFGFLELPEVAMHGGVAVTAAELGAEGLTKALPAPSFIEEGVFYITSEAS